NYIKGVNESSALSIINTEHNKDKFIVTYNNKHHWKEVIFVAASLQSFIVKESFGDVCNNFITNFKNSNDIIGGYLFRNCYKKFLPNSNNDLGIILNIRDAILILKTYSSCLNSDDLENKKILYELANLANTDEKKIKIYDSIPS